jgi:hypothetical protein
LPTIGALVRLDAVTCAAPAANGFGEERRRRHIMKNALFWLYLINAVALIIHEIDSAYWKEWELFRLPGGVTGFLALHVPLLLPVLYGLVLVDRGAVAGLLLCLAVGLAGVLPFSIHTYFIRRGREEFKSPVSLVILWTTLLLSLAQSGVALYILITS